MGRGRPGRRCVTPVPTWCGSSPGRGSTGCGRWPGAARTTWGSGCPEPLLTSRLTSPRTSSSPRASRWPCSRCSRHSRRPSVPCSCCARSSTCPTRRSQPPSTSPPAAVRQVAHRARGHVAARRPRMEVDRLEELHVVERFMAALSSGDVQALMDVLAPDVVVVADGGGLVAAARRPVIGADKVVAFLSSFSPLATETVVDTIWLNGAPGGRVVRDRTLDTVIGFAFAGRSDLARLRGQKPAQAGSDAPGARAREVIPPAARHVGSGDRVGNRRWVTRSPLHALDRVTEHGLTHRELAEERAAVSPSPPAPGRRRPRRAARARGTDCATVPAVTATVRSPAISCALRHRGLDRRRSRSGTRRPGGPRPSPSGRGGSPRPRARPSCAARPIPPVKSNSDRPHTTAPRPSTQLRQYSALAELRSGT